MAECFIGVDQRAQIIILLNGAPMRRT